MQTIGLAAAAKRCPSCGGSNSGSQEVVAAKQSRWRQSGIVETAASKYWQQWCWQLSCSVEVVEGVAIILAGVAASSGGGYGPHLLGQQPP